MTEEASKLSTGEPSTLKTYRGFAAVLFPKALPMLDERIARYGEDEPVDQDERQMLWLLAQIEFNGAPAHPHVLFTRTEIKKAWGMK